MDEYFDLTWKIINNMILYENFYLINKYGLVKNCLNTYYLYDDYICTCENNVVILQNKNYIIQITKNMGRYNCSYNPPVKYLINNLIINEVITINQKFEHSEKIIIDELYNCIYNVLSNKKLNGYECYID
jgi:hypothetical protein